VEKNKQFTISSESVMSLQKLDCHREKPKPTCSQTALDLLAVGWMANKGNYWPGQHTIQIHFI